MLKELRSDYPNISDIAAHSDIAPGRKTDPGKCFDWKKVDFIVCS
jgi:AmpD protein